MATVYKQRADEFGQRYEGMETVEIAGIESAFWTYGEELLSPQAIDKAVAANTGSQDARTSARGGGNAVLPWREVLQDSTAHWENPIQQEMVELHSYAYWGLRPDPGILNQHNGEDLGAAIGRFIARKRAFFEKTPASWGALAQCRQTVLAAEGRHDLDTGRNITVDPLAALAEVSTKSLRNLLAPGNGGDLKLDANGEISRTAALTWLHARPSFKTSIWRDADDDQPDEANEAEDALGEVAFVPVAKDGTWFDPVACRSPRGYTIGPKGAELPIRDYHEALARLARMPTPYWRRKNTAGSWGLVSGTAWQRREVRDLDSLARPYAVGAAS